MKYPASSAFILLGCLFLTSVLSAQQNRFRPAKKQSSSEQSFSVGLAPFSLLLPSGKVNLHGEWAYAPDKSLSLIVAVPRPTTVPGLVANNIDLSDNGEIVQNKFSSFGAILEQRFYLGQNAPRGFYLAPYARYNRFSVTRSVETDFETKITGAVGGFGLGVAAGVQFRIGDFLTLDATIAGVDLKWMRGTLKYSTDNPENDLAAFRDEVQETVGDIPIIGSKLSAQIDGNAVKVHTPGLLMPGYRFNLTVNYLF
ncbi:MAG: hypothetical protein KDC61_23310 [Saprospiraceae bacterium]|nr:hypothetical protein [Saprospiraceae bacterium]MCB0577509.1 hypothetical protein [Saprospiraceae bacterium]MCB9305717.1 hypothetical protein [Lewinellaceae bacterium]MCB9354039.1 hypothetical protein [Lewinellaceae bacterium]